MKKEIEFKEAELIEGMREAIAHAREKLTLKTTEISRRAYKISACRDRVRFRRHKRTASA